MKRPITNRMKEYLEQRRYPMHMPGHKGAMANHNFLTERENFWGFDSVYSVDVTEIPGLDDLHCPCDIIEQSMEAVANLYGAEHSFYLVNGSTAGNLAAVLAAGGPYLVARNCHKSIFHALGLRETECEYMNPGLDQDGICKGITVDDVTDGLLRMELRNISCRTIIITSPTYEGVGSDIGGIVKLAHKRGCLVIVDEAHGAHLPFMAHRTIRGMEFMDSAIAYGADFVIQSLHKTLPSMTQTALLHTGNISETMLARVKYYLRVVQSSSPSYVLMLAMENGIAYMDSDAGKKQMEQYFTNLSNFYHKIEAAEQKMTCFHFHTSAPPMDPSKIVIVIRKGILRTGHVLEKELREKYHIQMEMASLHYCIAMTSLCDDENAYFQLLEALSKIDREWAASAAVSSKPFSQLEEELWQFEAYQGRRGCSVSQALNCNTARIDMDDIRAVGCLSGDFVYLYPPGIPFLLPGEEITEKLFALLKNIREKGVEIHGLEDGKYTILDRT